MSSEQAEATVLLEQRLAQVEMQLAQAQKLAALGELLGTTTHEFNNILMTILNYARMGMRHTDQATRDKSFDKIHTAAQRAARITNTVLSMARNRTGNFEPIDLAVLIDDSLMLLEREMNKYRVSIDRQITPVPPVMANATQLQQMLLNMLVNARQAMPQGGTVVLKLGLDATKEMVELVIRDTGCGIPAGSLPKIFDRFYSTKSGPDESGKGGTGLGLAACKDIIESHRGRIRVESTVGRGTAFIIRLPAVSSPPAPISASLGKTTLPSDAHAQH